MREATYYYVGPVLSYGKCICQKWSGKTVAPTKEKALSNLKYQFKKQNKMMPNCLITMPGEIKLL